MNEELYRTFTTESEESITQLNNSFLSLESNSDGTEATDDILRQAHTLKGNSGAMDFDNAATVAHAVEDLLDGTRHERLDVIAERMNLVFNGMDLIVDILRDIEENGESTINPSDTVEKICTAVEDGGDAGNSDPAASNGADRESVNLSSLATDCTDTDALDATTLTHVHVEFDADQMKGVDIDIFFSNIPEDLDAVGANPPHDAIEDGEFGDGFGLPVVECSVAVIRNELDGLWKVPVVEATNMSDTPVAGDTTAIANDVLTADSDVDVERNTSTSSETESSADADADTAGDAGVDATADEQAGNDGSEGDADGAESTDGDDVDDAGDTDDADNTGDTDKGDDTEQKKEVRSISAVKPAHMDIDQPGELHELVEQLVVSRIKLRDAINVDQTMALDTLNGLDRVPSNFQDTMMDMRLIPLKKVFDKFPRLVRNLAREQDKRVSFEVEGADTELGRAILDEISDPLIHILRNAVSHDIEDPDVREANGRSRTGATRLFAYRQHDAVIVTVEDNGSGIDVDAVRKKIIDKGIATREEPDQMPDSEVYDYIFRPGSSTSDGITDVSDCDAGMDVVRTTVESLDGSVSIEGDPSEGSTPSIRLPVSVAIIKVLFVRVEGCEFGVPIKYVDEIGRRDRIRMVNGVEIIIHEETIFPLIRPREALGIDLLEPDDGTVAHIRPNGGQVALHYDGVTKQEEIVMAPPQGPLSGVGGLSGTTVIGDGNVIPISNVSTLQPPTDGEQVMREFDPNQLLDTVGEAVG